ncbi:hypothetical protein ES703_112231 [subsurface metagenome]
MAKGPFMEFLRAAVIMSGVDAYTEVTIPTPTSKTENLAMLIHSIYIAPNRMVDAAAPTTGDTIEVMLANKTGTAMKALSDPDVLAYFFSVTALAAVFNAIETMGALMWKFDPPILYPRANLYLGVDSSGFTAAMGAVCRIGYTLEKVSREDFISALVE